MANISPKIRNMTWIPLNYNIMAVTTKKLDVQDTS